MLKPVLTLFVAALICGSRGGASGTQLPERESVAQSPTSAAERGIGLAAKGHCPEALPLLRESLPHITDKDLRYDAAMASAQCGMSLDQVDAVVEALLLLKREFPDDTKVLYVTTRCYSELASRTAHKLLQMAPSSLEAQVLVAETFQTQGKWDEATAQYRKILEKYPNQPRIHYQIGRSILSKPLSPSTAEEAKEEFETELKINPTSALAEFMLGDLARTAQNSKEAIEHYSRATQFDSAFAPAYLGLGIALNAAGRYSEAINALGKYVEMEPSNPAGHYQLAIAYARTGNKQEADRQMALHRQAEEKWNKGAATPQDTVQPH
jgi:tetratricopeptide (TPR) repeat protein